MIRYCTCKKRNYFDSILGKIKLGTSYDQVLFISYSSLFLFFCPGDYGIIYFPNIFYDYNTWSSLVFRKIYLFLSFFNLLQFLGCMKVCSAREPKVRVIYTMGIMGKVVAWTRFVCSWINCLISKFQNVLKKFVDVYYLMTCEPAKCIQQYAPRNKQIEYIYPVCLGTLTIYFVLRYVYSYLHFLLQNANIYNFDSNFVCLDHTQ